MKLALPLHWNTARIIVLSVNKCLRTSVSPVMLVCREVQGGGLSGCPSIENEEEESHLLNWAPTLLCDYLCDFQGARMVTWVFIARWFESHI